MAVRGGVGDGSVYEPVTPHERVSRQGANAAGPRSLCAARGAAYVSRRRRKTAADSDMDAMRATGRLE